MKVSGLLRSLNVSATAAETLGLINDNFDAIRKILQKKLSLSDNLSCDVISGVFDSGQPTPLQLSALTNARGAIVLGSSVPCIGAPHVATVGRQAHTTLYFARGARQVRATVVLFEEGTAQYDPSTLIASTTAPGLVYPDGTSITMDSTGKLSSIGGGGGLTPISKSADYSANVGDLVVVTALTSNVLITLPSPGTTGRGALVGVKDAAYAAGGGTDGTGHILAINVATGGSNPIEQLFSQVYMMDDGGSVVFISDGKYWRILEGATHVGVDPRNVGTLTTWWDFGRGYTYAGPGSTGTPVRMGITGLADQSGSGLDLVFNAVHGTTPFLVRGGLTGRGRGLFDGGSSLESPAMTPSSSTVTIIAIFQSPKLEANSYQALIGQSADNTFGRGFAALATCGGSVVGAAKLFVSGEPNSTYGNLMGLGSSNYEIPMTPHCLGFTVDGTAPFIHFDGLDVTLSPTVSSTTISSPTHSNIYVGQDNFNGSNADYFTGTISEILVFIPGLSKSQTALVEQSLMKKHRIRL